MNKCHIYTTRIGWFLTRKFLQCSKLLKMKGFLMAGAERLELPTPGFGDRCSTNWTTPLLWYELAEWTGLEPATPCVTGRYSNQLNYHSAKNDDWQCLTLTWGNPTLPSALQHFTSEFGMVSGGSIALSLPKFFIFLIYSMNKLKK